MRFRARRQAQYAALRTVPSVTLDGERIAIHINAGLLFDLPHLDQSGADGIGLFRTELQFMISATFPRLEQQTRLYKAILDAAGDRPVVFRSLDVGGDYVARNLQCLAEDGRHVTIAVLGGLKATIDMALVMRKRLTLTGSTLRARSNEFKALLADEIARTAWPLIADGTIRPVMDRTFPLAEAGAAHARMEKGDHIGKIVLEVSGG